MSKPTRPTPLSIYDDDVERRVYDKADADAHITAIEQDRDEAVAMLRDVDNAYYERDGAASVVGALSRIGEFLARIEGGRP
ncbi:MAG: hypothetical protein ACOCSK_00325 [Rhodothermales bacterium]